MKINWGTAIVLSFVAFICFILFFVVRMGIDSSTNHDLVTEEYYKRTIEYQDEIDAETNAKNNAKITVEKTAEGLLLTFPDGIETKNVTGNISMYRPSNKQLDFDLDLNISDKHFLIPDKGLIEGRWDIKVLWEYKKEIYLHKESITY